MKIGDSFLVCAPGKEYFSFSDPEKHNIAEKPSELRAKKQHEKLRRTLIADGCTVIELEELEGHPNSVFVKDPAFVVPEGYIEMRMGLESRRGEERGITEKMEALGIEKIGRIEQGTAEGGDIIKADNTIFVGLSSRTNRDGAEEIARMLKPFGYDIRTVKVPERYLHLGGAVSYLSRGLLLCTADVYDIGKGFDTIVVDSTDFVSGNVIKAKSAVIAERENRSAIKELHEAGLKVIALDLSEFIKGRGGPSCLVLPIYADALSASIHR